MAGAPRRESLATARLCLSRRTRQKVRRQVSSHEGSEVEPLNIGPNNALRYNALKMTKNFGVLIDSVITRRTVRGDE